jgi:hypothetical protein
MLGGLIGPDPARHFIDEVLFPGTGINLPT